MGALRLQPPSALRRKSGISWAASLALPELLPPPSGVIQLSCLLAPGGPDIRLLPPRGLLHRPFPLISNTDGVSAFLRLRDPSHSQPLPPISAAHSAMVKGLCFCTPCPLKGAARDVKVLVTIFNFNLAGTSICSFVKLNSSTYL